MGNPLLIIHDKTRQLAENIWKNPRTVLAFVIVVGGFAYLFTLLFHKVPPESKDIINISAGIVLATVTTVANFYFGSSKDKSDQDKAERDNVAKDPPSKPAA